MKGGVSAAQCCGPRLPTTTRRPDPTDPIVDPVSLNTANSYGIIRNHGISEKIRLSPISAFCCGDPKAIFDSLVVLRTRKFVRFQLAEETGYNNFESKAAQHHECAGPEHVIRFEKSDACVVKVRTSLPQSETTRTRLHAPRRSRLSSNPSA